MAWATNVFIARASERNNNKEQNINVHCQNKYEIEREKKYINRRNVFLSLGIQKSIKMK